MSHGDGKRQFFHRRWKIGEKHIWMLAISVIFSLAQGNPAFDASQSEENLGIAKHALKKQAQKIIRSNCRGSRSQKKKKKRLLDSFAYVSL